MDYDASDEAEDVNNVDDNLNIHAVPCCATVLNPRQVTRSGWRGFRIKSSFGRKRIPTEHRIPKVTARYGIKRVTISKMSAKKQKSVQSKLGTPAEKHSSSDLSLDVSSSSKRVNGNSLIPVSSPSTSRPLIRKIRLDSSPTIMDFMKNISDDTDAPESQSDYVEDETWRHDLNQNSKFTPYQDQRSFPQESRDSVSTRKQVRKKRVTFDECPIIHPISEVKLDEEIPIESNLQSNLKQECQKWETYSTRNSRAKRFYTNEELQAARLELFNIGGPDGQKPPWRDCAYDKTSCYRKLEKSAQKEWYSRPCFNFDLRPPELPGISNDSLAALFYQRRKAKERNHVSRMMNIMKENLLLCTKCQSVESEYKISRGELSFFDSEYKFERLLNNLNHNMTAFCLQSGLNMDFVGYIERKLVTNYFRNPMHRNIMKKERVKLTRRERNRRSYRMRKLLATQVKQEIQKKNVNYKTAYERFMAVINEEPNIPAPPTKYYPSSIRYRS